MKKEISILGIILLIAAFLRFFNLMHDSPYFFNPDERNMANAISQLRLPSDLSQIPICLISQFRPIIGNDSGSSPASRDPGSSNTNNCNLNPHFFSYGQFPLYLAFISDQVIQSFWQVPLNGTRPESQWDPGQARMTTFPSAIFWLRFWSALSSTLTVLLVYLITKQFLHYQAKKWDVRNVKLDNEMGSGKKNLTSHFNNPASHFPLLTSILAAFTPGLIQSAHFGTTESFLTFFFLLSVYISLSYLSHLSHLKFILLTSVVIGLALGSKLTGIFFFIPPASALMIRIIEVLRKKGKKKIYKLFVYLFICLLVFIGSITTFVVASPYNLVEPENFKSAVFGYEQDVATGRYEAFYTRQFVNTTPIIFQAEKIFPYALGWPVFILGSIGFLLMSISLLLKLIQTIVQSIKYQVLRIRYKKIKNKNILNTYYVILTTSFLVYLLPNASLFAKWTRFMTPVLPFFSIFAGYFLGNAPLPPLKVRGGIRGSYLIGLLVFISILPGIAFMSIYTHEDTRITASKWIYQNIPNGSYVLSETANVVDIPLGLTSKASKPHQVCAAHTWCEENRNYQVISFDFYHMDENPKLLFNDLLMHLEKADYIFIPSRRIFANYTKLPQIYPLVTKYYQLLNSSALGFEKISEFSSFPNFTLYALRFTLPDETAEETFTVFDHPVIRIYRKIKPMTTEEYEILFLSPNNDPGSNSRRNDPGSSRLRDPQIIILIYA